MSIYSGLHRQLAYSFGSIIFLHNNNLIQNRPDRVAIQVLHRLCPIYDSIPLQPVVSAPIFHKSSSRSQNACWDSTLSDILSQKIQEQGFFGILFLALA